MRVFTNRVLRCESLLRLASQSRAVAFSIFKRCIFTAMVPTSIMCFAIILTSCLQQNCIAQTISPCQKRFASIAINVKIEESEDGKLEAFDDFLKEYNVNIFNFGILEKKGDMILFYFKDDKSKYSNLEVGLDSDINNLVRSHSPNTNALICIGDIEAKNLYSDYQVFRTYGGNFGSLIFKLRELERIVDVKPENVSIISLLPANEKDISGWVDQGEDVNKALLFLEFHLKLQRHTISGKFRSYKGNINSKSQFVETYRKLHDDKKTLCIVIVGHSRISGRDLFLTNGSIMQDFNLRECDQKRYITTAILSCQTGKKKGAASHFLFDFSTNILTTPHKIGGKQIKDFFGLIEEGKNKGGDMIRLARNSKLEWLFTLTGLFVSEGEDTGKGDSIR